MKEPRRVAFWAGLAALQVVFGLVVFAATRYYYVGQQPSPTATAFPTPSRLPPNATTTLPSPALDNAEDLARNADERFLAGEYAEAAALYGRLNALQPTDVATINNLALTLHHLGRSEEAVKLLSDGLAIDSQHQRAWLTLGFVSAQIGDTAMANLALNNAVGLDPENDVGQSAAKMLTDLGLPAPLR
jgi:tetratricopeptide (TPR) repeat protein